MGRLSTRPGAEKLLYRRADECGPDRALSLDKIDEQYEREVRRWRLN